MDWPYLSNRKRAAISAAWKQSSDAAGDRRVVRDVVGGAMFRDDAGVVLPVVEYAVATRGVGEGLAQRGARGGPREIKRDIGGREREKEDDGREQEVSGQVSGPSEKMLC